MCVVRPVSPHLAALLACLAFGCSGGAPPGAEGATDRSAPGSAIAEGATPDGALRSLGERQGVVFVWTRGPFRDEYRLGGGRADAPSIADVRRVAPILADELAPYPPGFLAEAGVDTVFLVAGLRAREEGVEAPVPGYLLDRTFWLDVRSALAVVDRGRRVKFLHHLIWHQLDGLWGTLWDDPEWVALNPEGFAYGVTSEGGIHDRRSGTGRLITDYPGFLNLYGTGNVPDDKAEVFAYLMVLRPWVIEHAASDPYLSAKIALIENRLAGFAPDLGAAFWARVAARGGDPAPY